MNRRWTVGVLLGAVVAVALFAIFEGDLPEAFATRHSPAGTAVGLTGAPAAGGWSIEVGDQGPGIPVSARPSIFERFARADDARGRDGGGAGLGLALSRAIAESHGGSLGLADQNGRGATFRLFLPK